MMMIHRDKTKYNKLDRIKKKELRRAKSRRESSIFNLRHFHNWIKRKMIGETTKYLEETYDIKNVSLLDLAVGKGGDMNKWYATGIKKVVGVDIDRESIEGSHGAKARYQRLKRRTKDLDYSFYVMDLSKPEAIDKLDRILGDQKFDIVSCQFALHYFFKDNESLQNLLRIVGKFIRDDGFFIGTTMDGDKVLNLFGDKEEVSKPIYHFEKKSIDRTSKYGQEYLVSLGEKEGEMHYFVDKPSLEYLVDLEELKAVAKNNNLMFIGVTPFQEWYRKYLDTDPEYFLREGNGEQEFSFLNFSFYFTSKDT